MRARATGLALGYLADRLLGDPNRLHPVAGFGRLASAVEARTYADSRAAGAGHVLVLVGVAALLGRAVPDRTLGVAACTWVVLGGRSLSSEAAAVHGHLAAGDLDAAREQVTHLVGRDPTQLGPPEIARATVESVAENTSDAVVAPLLWGAVAGPAGLLGYRAVNTLDAMVGHRSPRYQRFGWAAARLDDVANLAPSRVSALLAALLAPAGRHRAALVAWRRDAPRHPSPNAGPVEAAFAGALGIRLGGTNRYGDDVQDRGHLGDGAPPTPPDIMRAVGLADRVGLAALAAAVLAAAGPVGRAVTPARARRHARHAS